jgi:hypothetical protein
MPVAVLCAAERRTLTAGAPGVTQCRRTLRRPHGRPARLDAPTSDRRGVGERWGFLRGFLPVPCLDVATRAFHERYFPRAVAGASKAAEFGEGGRSAVDGDESPTVGDESRTNT